VAVVKRQNGVSVWPGKVRPEAGFKLLETFYLEALLLQDSKVISQLFFIDGILIFAVANFMVSEARELIYRVHQGTLIKWNHISSVEQVAVLFLGRVAPQSSRKLTV
jgi:hypothetical protein